MPDKLPPLPGKPTVTGWYWYKTKRERMRAVEIFVGGPASKHPGKPFVWIMGELRDIKNWSGRFYGPLQEPEE